MSFMGIRVHACAPHQVLDRIFAALEWGLGGWVITANLHILRQMVRDPEMRSFGREADLVVADGMPLVWASRLAGERRLQRVAGSSLVYPLCEMAARAGRSVYFLGGDPGAAQTAARTLGERYPRLDVAGWCCPDYGFDKDPEQVEAVRAELRARRPDIVLVCLGAPKQERLIRVLREDLPSSWFLGLGISLGFISGQLRRAPESLQKLGLEWLHRMMQEPRRLGRRYVVEGIPFAWRLGAHAVGRRLSRVPYHGPLSSPRQPSPPLHAIEPPERSVLTERGPGVPA